MRTIKHWLVFLGACFIAGLVLTAAPAMAETWPQRPVPVILPVGAGSGVDITARIFAERLESDSMGLNRLGIPKSGAI
jgi:tripartite-type tricarboxylate transporter receptor subunit TctC